ncbi:MAG: DUF72 domain-containing protein [Ferruginibacter sp.]
MERSINNRIYSGTSGLVLPGAKSSFPPSFRDKSRLYYYASLYNSIEINSSFYRPPMISTIQKWAGSVPEDFQFTFKLPKYITHAKGLNFIGANVFSFIDTINYIGDKQGCILVQFPPGLKIGLLSQVEKLLYTLGKSGMEKRWKIAVEFRDSGWYDDITLDLLKKFNANLVVHDLPSSCTPLREYPGDISYIRLHGPGGRYRGSYDESFLTTYALYINELRDSGKAVYFYFNNTMGDAINNLNRLNQLVKAERKVRCIMLPDELF